MTGKMKALRKMKPGPGLEMQEVPIPAIKGNEVLIKVHKRAICGTDLHIYKWDEWSQNRLKPPVTTGPRVLRRDRRRPAPMSAITRWATW